MSIDSIVDRSNSKPVGDKADALISFILFAGGKLTTDFLKPVETGFKNFFSNKNRIYIGFLRYLHTGLCIASTVSW